MKIKTIHAAAALLVLIMLMTMLSGCGKNDAANQAVPSEKSQAPEGTWQTATMGYEADGTMEPEHYVQFTDTEILYGRLKDGKFVPEYSDKISLLEEAAAGRIKVQAESSNGGQYTYQTSEGDDTVLEYYETWKEEDFPEMYRGGASLSRVS
ncbi:MAG: hypothetical protein Q4F31_07830 [Eubacteriales bacterium]|nr:hypothetical protein [Eubacteriales bacterium]